MHRILFKFQNGLIFLIFLLTLKAKLTNTKDTQCYTPIFLDTSWTDRKPYFRVNMTFNKHGSIKSSTWLEADIATPIAKLRILQKEGEKKIVTLYDVSARLCDMQQYLNKVPLFKQGFQAMTKQGNYTFSCPFKQGFYIMENIRFPSKNPLLIFMYRPKTTYTFLGGMYEEAANKSLISLTTYNFTMKVVKKPCKDLN